MAAVELRRSPRQHPPPSLRHAPVPGTSSVLADPHSSRQRDNSLRKRYDSTQGNATTSTQWGSNQGGSGVGAAPAKRPRDIGSTQGQAAATTASEGSSVGAEPPRGHLNIPGDPADGGLLPSLLAHLPALPTFSCDTSAPAFTFSAPFGNWLRSASPPEPSHASSSSPSAACTCATKRDSSSSSPNPHLPSPERTKKKKVHHRFIRDPLLLAGPAKSAAASPVSTSASPARSPSRTPSTSSWWPSVSRSFGQGVESRLGPAEEEWTGDGGGWVAQLSLRLNSLDVSSSETGDATNVPPGEPGHPMRPPLHGRSFSSPAILGLRPPVLEPFQSTTAEQASPALEGPALKQLLLRNLRERLASEGGTSKAGEAGLRFKKWVVWNSFTRRQRYEPPTDPDLDLVGEGFFAGTFDGDTSLETDDDLMEGEFDFGALPVPPESLLPLQPEDAPTAEEEEPLAAFSTYLVADEDDAPSSVAEQDTTPRSLAPERPGLRRTASLPNVPLSRHTLSCDSTSSRHDAQAGTVDAGGWTAVGAGRVVACEG
ncbi:hypothetical protein JCM10207_002014 [Rhodosporidiobolus poonsookiae]